MNTPIELEFLDSHFIADVAARVLSTERTKNFPDASPETRTYCRMASVHSLRFLWRSKNSDARKSVIARVLVWTSPDCDKAGEAIKRVQTRLQKCGHLPA